MVNKEPARYIKLEARLPVYSMPTCASLPKFPGREGQYLLASSLGRSNGHFGSVQCIAADEKGCREGAVASGLHEDTR